MSRVIRFRGRHVVTGEWFYGSLLAPNIIGVIEQNDKRDGRGRRPELAEFCVVDPETVGQFVGLLDRSNKEIYEGDILQSGRALTRPRIVTFSQAQFILEGSMLSLSGEIGTNENIEVIGNLYEHPHLLEESS
ncbi:YopX family protein [Rhodococcus sp. NPDC056516]|uniref:YopX family protein n=1 Tax=Rhodococcus sp. NPDC056516 TaxID=3345847 RepID=UPI00366CFA8B